jgi:mono/diheme cytochrome c family protein
MNDRPGPVRLPSSDEFIAPVTILDAQEHTDEEVAAVLSYERTSWGNQAKPVKPDEVVARRK